MRNHTGAPAALALAALFAAAPPSPARAAESARAAETAPRCAAHDALRRPFFGDLHVHTAYSFDASTQDTRNTPRDAYRFARGDEIGIQPYDGEGRATRRIRLSRPLDFAAVTDHAELLGEVQLCTTRGSPAWRHPVCIIHRNLPWLAFRMIATRTLHSKKRWGFCGQNGAICRISARNVWRDIRAAAEEANDSSPACRFSSFVGYEWTATVDNGRNLHRNVIFKNEKVPERPASWVETSSAVELWDRLQADCLDGSPGCDAITIPHNSNLSGGLLFETASLQSGEDAGAPFEPGRAKRRARFEPLVEIMQHKGDSECDDRAGFGDDEACGFENLPYGSFGAKFTPFSREPAPGRSSFVRGALGIGLRLQAAIGANPFRYGIIASTDTHIAAPGLTAERGHPGHGGAGLGAGGDVPAGFPDDLEFNPGGLAVLWAEENSREALFAAMQRREAYGTSGTRPLLRFFGGWNYGENLCQAPDFAARGYASGVPMGGALPPAPQGEAPAPSFAVWALQDPGSESQPGSRLQRIQIVKGWFDGELSRERVLDVAGGPNDAGVDTATCQPTNPEAGAKQLCAVWRDADFDPNAPAFYYARVLENPTCRWSQYVCNAAGVNCARPGSIPKELRGCCAEEHRPVIQERAWTSPIWFTPAHKESAP